MGAPSALIKKSIAAAEDERHHAEVFPLPTRSPLLPCLDLYANLQLCYSLASAYRGFPVSPGTYTPCTLRIGYDVLVALYFPLRISPCAFAPFPLRCNRCCFNS